MKFILIFATILISLSKAAIFSTGKVDILHADPTLQTAAPNTSITITIDSKTKLVQFHMITYTPSTIWTGFGFEYFPYIASNYHENTYAIILEYDINFQPIVTEYTLAYKSKGTIYSIPELTIISDTSNGLWREVIATRPITGTFTFPDATLRNNFQMIVTSAVHFKAPIYATSLRHRENPHERNFKTVTFQLLDIPRTPSPISIPLQTTQQPSNSPIFPLCCECTTSTLNSGCDIDPQCEQQICIQNADFLCCDSSYIWDEACACQAHNICNAPTRMPTRAPTTTLATCCACTIPVTATGCSIDKKCEDAICSVDEYCCNTEWDALCAPQAQDICILATPLPTSIMTTIIIPNVICTPRPTTQIPTPMPIIRTRKPSRMRSRRPKGRSDESKSSSASIDSLESGEENSKQKTEKKQKQESKSKKKEKKKSKSKKKKKHYVIADDEEAQEGALQIDNIKQERSGMSIVYICVCVFGAIGVLMIGMVICLKCWNIKSRKEHVKINVECIEDEIEDDNEDEIEIIEGTEGTIEENESLKI